LVRSARVHQLVKNAGTFGTRTGEVALDWDTIVRRQHAIVRELQPPPDAFERSGAKVYLADARFVDAHTLQANGSQVHGEKIVIAAGSEPVVPALSGRELAITSDQILFLPRFPESLVLVGGGAIGLEMAGSPRSSRRSTVTWRRTSGRSSSAVGLSSTSTQRWSGSRARPAR
jgi:pyruvate/2-oxoglutarate dehydrogenase complex dihydrolipoamide dehydrogenase (E3) component